MEGHFCDPLDIHQQTVSIESSGDAIENAFETTRRSRSRLPEKRSKWRPFCVENTSKGGKRDVVKDHNRRKVELRSELVVNMDNTQENAQMNVEIQQETVMENSATEWLSVRVKTLEPATYDLRVNKNISIGELKKEIEREAHVSADRQRLLFCGRVLADDSIKLEDSGVKDGHTLHMVERPPDVPPQPQNNAPPGPQGPQPQLRNGNFVHHISIGTVNGGMGEASTSVDSIIASLVNMIGTDLQRRATSQQGSVPPGAQPPGVQVGEVEINIDTVSSAQQGGPQTRSPPRSIDNHPFMVLRSFIQNATNILDSYQSQSPLFDRNNDAGEAMNSNANAMHFDVECDICGACPIRGPRFKSLSEGNYDLCCQCVRTEGARSHEPFVQIDVPLVSQLESLLGGLRVNRQEQSALLRNAAREVLGQRSEEPSSSSQEANAIGITQEVSQAMCDLLKKVMVIVQNQGSDLILRQMSTLLSQVENLEDNNSRYAMQGNLVHLSTTLNTLGAMMIEMGRMFGGLSVSSVDDPNSNVLRITDNGYIHPNASQFSIPMPLLMDRRSAIVLGMPGLMHAFANNPNAAQPGAGNVQNAAQSGATNPELQNPGNVMDALRNMASNLSTSQSAPSAAGLHAGPGANQAPNAAQPGAGNVQNAAQSGATNPELQNPGNVMDALRNMASNLSTSQSAPSAAGLHAGPGANQAPNAAQSEISNEPHTSDRSIIVPGAFGNVEVSNVNIVQTVRRTPENSQGNPLSDVPTSNVSHNIVQNTPNAETGTLPIHRNTSIDTSEPQLQAPITDNAVQGQGGLNTMADIQNLPSGSRKTVATEVKEEEEGANERGEASSKSNAVGIGAGLRPRRTVLRRVPKQTKSSAQSSSSALERTSRGASNGPDIASVVNNIAQSPIFQNIGQQVLQGQMTSSQSGSGHQEGNFLQQMMPLMSQMFSGPSSAREDLPSDEALNSDNWERVLEKNLCSEDQQRWKAIIEADEEYQRSNEKIEFSEAYKQTFKENKDS